VKLVFGQGIITYLQPLIAQNPDTKTDPVQKGVVTNARGSSLLSMIKLSRSMDMPPFTPDEGLKATDEIRR
jgi:hypothetical protein